MDNQRWKSDELVLYFEAMQKKLHALDPQLYPVSYTHLDVYKRQYQY